MEEVGVKLYGVVAAVEREFGHLNTDYTLASLRADSPISLLEPTSGRR